MTSSKPDVQAEIPKLINKTEKQSTVVLFKILTFCLSSWILGIAQPHI